MLRSHPLLLAAALVLTGSPRVSAWESPPGSGFEDLVNDIGRWAVALRVDREEEPPVMPPGMPVKSGVRIPPEVLEYYKRPPGPATGVLLDAKGNVLTSYYNVAGKVRSIELVLPSGRTFPARLVATAKADDLALVRTQDPIGDLEVPPVPWADPERFRVGRIVVAVGRSPDPSRPTATAGIVSAIGRNGGRVFQTDAKLNYGNVGGPVADLDGSILGIACFVGHTYPLWGQNSGIGFGTRSDTIRSVLPRLLAGESLPPPEFPFFGIGMSSRPAEGNVGARIGQVEPGSAAARAGLQVDDVIVSFNGNAVGDFLDLRRFINRQRPGDEVTVRVKRGAEELELKVRLGKRRD